MNFNLKKIAEVETMEKVDEKYLNERFNAFLEKQGIDPHSMSEEALFVFRTGHRYLLIPTLEGGV